MGDQSHGPDGTPFALIGPPRESRRQNGNVRGRSNTSRLRSGNSFSGPSRRGDLQAEPSVAPGSGYFALDGIAFHGRALTVLLGPDRPALQSGTRPAAVGRRLEAPWWITPPAKRRMRKKWQKATRGVGPPEYAALESRNRGLTKPTSIGEMGQIKTVATFVVRGSFGGSDGRSRRQHLSSSVAGMVSA